jgi:MYXO-CTERM domain-containing protein
MRMRAETPIRATDKPAPVGRSHKRIWSVWWVLIVLSLGFVWAGLAVAAAPGELKINRVNPGTVGGTVDVFLTATYDDGSSIPGLTNASFTVQVGDRPASQPSAMSPPSDQLSIVFIMDFTTTVRQSGGLKALQDATEDFVKKMQPGDWAAIVKYNIDAGAEVVSPFAELIAPINSSTGESALNDVIYADYPGTGTNLNQAVKLALDHIENSKALLPQGRTAVVLLADGEDNYEAVTGLLPNPSETQAKVIEKANILNVPIFTIGVADVLTGGNGSWLVRMEGYAAQTGGQFFNATENAKAEIDKAFATVSDLLTNEYQITFAGVNTCEPQTFTVSVADLGLSATGQFTHRGCSTSGGGGGGGGGAFGPWWLITGVALLALRRRLRAT